MSNGIGESDLFQIVYTANMAGIVSREERDSFGKFVEFSCNHGCYANDRTIREWVDEWRAAQTEESHHDR